MQRPAKFTGNNILSLYTTPEDNSLLLVSAALLASTAENIWHWIQCLKGSKAALKDWKEENKQSYIHIYDTQMKEPKRSLRPFARIRIDQCSAFWGNCPSGCEKEALPRNSCETFILRKSTDAGICDRAPDTRFYRSSTISYHLLGYLLPAKTISMCVLQGQDHCSPLRPLMRMIWKAWLYALHCTESAWCTATALAKRLWD